MCLREIPVLVESIDSTFFYNSGRQCVLMILEQVTYAGMWSGSLQTAGVLDVSDCYGKLVNVSVVESAVNPGVLFGCSASDLMKSRLRAVSTSRRWRRQCIRLELRKPGNTAWVTMRLCTEVVDLLLRVSLHRTGCYCYVRCHYIWTDWSTQPDCRERDSVKGSL